MYWSDTVMYLVWVFTLKLWEILYSVMRVFVQHGRNMLHHWSPSTLTFHCFNAKMSAYYYVLNTVAASYYNGLLEYNSLKAQPTHGSLQEQLKCQIPSFFQIFSCLWALIFLFVIRKLSLSWCCIMILFSIISFTCFGIMILFS